jgi:polyketide cyclase/dehydrase/lipid transport protein
MQADTQAISIGAGARQVFRFVADPRNLPRWAVGFARSVRQENGRWYVAAAAGEVEVRVESDENSGVVDFRLTLAPGVEALAASRVLPRGTGCEYVFTQFQAPGMPEAVFEKSVAAVRHELSVLKAIAEVECPF